MSLTEVWVKFYWFGIVGVSLLLHLAVGVSLVATKRGVHPEKYQKVSLQLRTVPKPVAAETPKAQPTPEPKKVAPEPKSQAQAKQKPKPSPKSRKPVPVQGLNAKSLADGPSTFTAPVGNSLQTSDQGIRLAADQVEELPEDLSSAAELIRDSVQKPVYTDAARDAELEGDFVVAVFVDSQGLVTEAELDRPVGFGMDERLRASALKARFRPRLDKNGKALSGWTSLSFSLQID